MQIIAIGLLLNYAVRLDLSLSSNFYKITIGVIALGSLLIELLFGILVDDLPIMEYFSVLIFLPLSVGTMLLFAVKRG